LYTDGTDLTEKSFSDIFRAFRVIRVQESQQLQDINKKIFSFQIQ
jgi:hypothetical protein